MTGISRGLLISLGTTVLCSALIFYYFKQTNNLTNHKTDTIFKLLHTITEELSILKQQNQITQQNQLTQQNTNPINFSQDIPENIIQLNTTLEHDLIDVSDDDSDSDSDSDSENNNGINLDNSVSEKGNIDIKSINLGSEISTNDIDNFMELNKLHLVSIGKIIDVEDLIQSANTTDIEYDNDSENNTEYDDDSVIEVEGIQVEGIQVEGIQVECDNTLQIDTDVIVLEKNKLLNDLGKSVNYNKMSLIALKEIATTMGLINKTNKLRKKEIIKLLEEN